MEIGATPDAIASNPAAINVRGIRIRFLLELNAFSAQLTAYASKQHQADS
jgi:hypothetical protein